MPVVKVTPSGDHRVPFDMEPDQTENFLEEVAVAANTAEMLEELGAPLEIDPVTLDR